MSAVQTASSGRRSCPTCRAVFRQAFQRCPLDGAELDELDGDPLVGSVLHDRYVIEACVGEGGMGRVYRAKHQTISRRYAVKVLYGDLASDANMRERFKREAEAASRLQHPNVVGVMDFDATPAGLLYIVMEYVEGPSLTKLVTDEGALECDRAVSLLRQLASGLEHAHARGLVHRDFKPDNIIVARTEDGETPKILDFGIARIMDAGATGQLTTHGAVMGTPAFMSPEQASGEELDHRTDLFSLGMVMYYMSTGVLPFDGDPMGVLRQNLALQPPPMAQRAPGVPIAGNVQAIVDRLLAKDAADRFQSARDVVSAIDAWWAPPRMRRVLTPDPGSLPRLDPALLQETPTNVVSSSHALWQVHDTPSSESSSEWTGSGQPPIAFEPTTLDTSPRLSRSSSSSSLARQPSDTRTRWLPRVAVAGIVAVASLSVILFMVRSGDDATGSAAGVAAVDRQAGAGARRAGTPGDPGTEAVANRPVIEAEGETAASGVNGVNGADGVNGGERETGADAGAQEGAAPDSGERVAAGNDGEHSGDVAMTVVPTGKDGGKDGGRDGRDTKRRPPRSGDDRDDRAGHGGSDRHRGRAPEDIYERRHTRIANKLNALYAELPKDPDVVKLLDEFAGIPSLGAFGGDRRRFEAAVRRLEAVERRLETLRKRARGGKPK